MTDAGRHPNITLHTLAEISGVTGYVGNFEVEIIKRAKYVDETACTSCGECAVACPVVFPDEFNEGLASRKAIHIPFPQAVPSSYLINMDECMGRGCSKCMDVCDKNCIDFNMSDGVITEKVGTIVVATGLEPYDPKAMDEYGYTRFENVVTSVEFERLVNAGGPTKGELVRPLDRKVPKSVGFVQCVGSRSRRRGGEHCSNICCMNTIKSTLILKEHYPDMEITVFYMDIRAFGKGFEDLYNRSRRLGVKYLRGLPGSVEELPNGSLQVAVENMATARVDFHELEMLVLALGINAPRGTRELQEMLGLQLTPDGFYLEAHPKLLPVDAATRGVFYAGCAEGPKDIKESVTQGTAAASRAVRLMHKGEIASEPITASVVTDLCNACGICARVCPYNAITVDVKKKIPAVVNTAACAGCGTCGAECRNNAIVLNHFTDRQINTQTDAMLANRPAEKIVVFACNWCSYAGADFAGVSRLSYPSNVRLIRTMCSGRVDESFIWRAFESGAPVVLVSGCHIGDCHYIDANKWTVKRVERIHKKMAKKGIRPERLQLSWISAAEGVRFARVMADMEDIRKTVTGEEIRDTIAILAEP
ncbi:CoB--CoM heterodisulfide reductase subunit A [Desulfocicer vacuolatum DSM 3385]|uniref:CoB--CoM heterodisulfide reductase subunit A n=3 Tax=Desulfocicer vacuolatum TaxID=2298 RepID=A0A1W2E6E0_9BACT|nr:CoB--CoM heterodisulfide reductase subunit A [Desulfocicer vacuolatum DSM 3385]